MNIFKDIEKPHITSLVVLVSLVVLIMTSDTLAYGSSQLAQVKEVYKEGDVQERVGVVEEKKVYAEKQPISSQPIYTINEMELEGPGGRYVVKIYLHKGWNIIPGTIPRDGIFGDSDIQKEDILVSWYYSPIQKKYIQIYPNTDWNGINIDSDDFVLTNAFWVYSKRPGIIKYSTLEDYPPLNQRKLYTGWNFVSITPDMQPDTSNPNFAFDSIEGSCDFRKIYAFRANNQNWEGPIHKGYIFEAGNFYEDLVGTGLLIKVIDNCTLNRIAISPPLLPN